jgi:hypothetical protein
MPFDFTEVCFGRLDHDPARAAAVEPHLLAAESPAPADFPLSDIIWTPSLVKNNILPTCTMAGMLNAARIWALRHGFDLVSDDDSLLADFARIAGCADTIAAIAATDGLMLLDVMYYAAAGKFDVGEQATLIPRVKRIDFTNMDAIRDAIVNTGSACIGVTLLQADVQPGAKWLGKPKNAGPAAGGHCITLYKYSANGLFGAATWGDTIEVDEAWVDSRTNEAYSLDWTFPV